MRAAYLRVCLLLAAITALPGCIFGGQTGGEEAVPAECAPEPRQQVTLTQRAPLGFSADDVLRLSAGDHALSAIWPVTSVLQADVAGTPASATLTLSAIDRNAYVIATRWSGSNRIAHEPCVSRLEISTHAKLVLSNARGDATLQLDGVLRAQTADMAVFEGQRDQRTVTASDAQFVLQPDEHVVRYAISAQLTPDESSGSLDVSVSNDEPTRPLARWPAGAEVPP